MLNNKTIIKQNNKTKYDLKKKSYFLKNYVQLGITIYIHKYLFYGESHGHKHFEVVIIVIGTEILIS